MAIKRSELPPDVQEIGSILGQLAKESDRGGALIAAALVDDSLGHYVRSHFVEDKGPVKELMSGDAPLATFSSKIKMAYCIGWIGKELRGDLDLIRNIRNEFAHDRSGLTFETSAVRDRCNAFRCVAIYNQFTQIKVATARNAYLMSCSFISAYFINLTRQENQPHPNNDDAYGVYVKTTTGRIDVAVVARLMTDLESAPQS